MFCRLAGMNLEAVGAYLAELRRSRGLSQAHVGAVAGVTDDIVLRIEKGRGETAGSVLLRIIDCVGGSCGDVLRLFNEADATADDGRYFAQQQLVRSGDSDRMHGEPVVLDRYDVTAEIRRIATLPTLEEREAELRKLPPDVFETIETVALDLMRLTLLRRRG